MKILLLHPEDKLSQLEQGNGWDLVVDLARAPVSTYESWSREARCRVLSLYDFADEARDLHQLKELLQLGMGFFVDQEGIDWWDVLSLMIVPTLQRLILVQRLAKSLGQNCELYSSRPDPAAAALATLLGKKLVCLETRFQSLVSGARHYLAALGHLDRAQLAQVLQDKFDRQHALRRRLARPRQSSTQPVVLLPSAYVNVSRAAVAYARMLPAQRFLLVCARNTARLRDLPENVQMASLDPYFITPLREERADLMRSWERLKSRLVSTASEFAVAEGSGVLERIPFLIPWGIAVRNAWKRVFESENVIACLCADDSNPYSRIPLILAKQRRIPALACHHGALDSGMAVKTHHADCYLVKGEMERDYLTRVCKVAEQKIVAGAPHAGAARHQRGGGEGDRSWLVFFTEPYKAWGWRGEEIYRDLVPRLLSLARTSNLKLVFKLHPFESGKAHRGLLRKLLPGEWRTIGIVTGPSAPLLWRRTQFAMTVQSSIALECAALAIPVFLCAWLRAPYGAYTQQYERFGVGQTLESPEQISAIPRMLESQVSRPLVESRLWQSINPEKLQGLLSGRHSVADTVKASA